MHGNGRCPVKSYFILCAKSDCEWWDEHDQECAVNLLVRFVRMIEGARKE